VVQDWFHSSEECRFESSSDPMLSSSAIFLVSATTKTWAFLSAVQPKKRANTQSQYWYCDISLLVVKRRIVNSSETPGDWIGEECRLQGVQRICDCELFLDPDYEYCIIPFSFGTCSGMKTIDPIQSFCFSTYSSSPVHVQRLSRGASTLGSLRVVSTLHKEILKVDDKVLHILGPQCCLLVAQGRGCVIFVALNASTTHCLQLRLCIDLKDPILLAYGKNDDVHVVYPRAQLLCLALTCDGRQQSANISYSFWSDSMTNASMGPTSAPSVLGSDVRSRLLGSNIELTLSGDLLVGELPIESGFKNGKGHALIFF